MLTLAHHCCCNICRQDVRLPTASLLPQPFYGIAVFCLCSHKTGCTSNNLQTLNSRLNVAVATFQVVIFTLNFLWFQSRLSSRHSSSERKQCMRHSDNSNSHLTACVLFNFSTLTGWNLKWSRQPMQTQNVVRHHVQKNAGTPFAHRLSRDDFHSSPLKTHI